MNILKALGATSALALVSGAACAEEDSLSLLMQAEETMQQCIDVTEVCGEAIESAAGVLVFPEVLKADLIIGGAGGNGVLMIDGEPTGFYDIGKASVGLQAGIDEMGMVFAVQDEETLNDIQEGDDWEVGATMGVTLIATNADAMTASSDTTAFVLDADGLNAEVDVTVFRIWQDPENAR